MDSSPDTLIQLKWSYHVIGAEHKDPVETIKKRYKLLVKQHHPDQFATDPDKQQTATKKLQEINAAYQQIRHAPLRYHISTHPKVQERYERKQQHYQQRAERYEHGQTRRPPPRKPPRPPREFSLFGWAVESVLHFVFGWGFGFILIFLITFGIRSRHFGLGFDYYGIGHRHYMNWHELGIDRVDLIFVFVPFSFGILALLLRNKFWNFWSGINSHIS